MYAPCLLLPTCLLRAFSKSRTAARIWTALPKIGHTHHRMAMKQSFIIVEIKILSGVFLVHLSGASSIND